MSQIWCRECGDFVDLDNGRCVNCRRVIRGYEPVPTYDSPRITITIDHREILSTADMVERLGLATSTVTTMVNDGRLPAMRNGGVWVFYRDVIDEWEKRGRPREDDAVALYSRARNVR